MKYLQENPNSCQNNGVTLPSDVVVYVKILTYVAKGWNRCIMGVGFSPFSPKMVTLASVIFDKNGGLSLKGKFRTKGTHY